MISDELKHNWVEAALTHLTETSIKGEEVKAVMNLALFVPNGAIRKDFLGGRVVSTESIDDVSFFGDHACDLIEKTLEIKMDSSKSKISRIATALKVSYGLGF